MPGLNRRSAWMTAICAPVLIASFLAAINSSGDLKLAMTTFATSLLVLLLVVSTLTDILWHKIPNWATYTALGWGMALNAAVSLSSPLATVKPSDLVVAPTIRLSPGVAIASIGPIGLQQSAFGAAACFGVMLFAYQLLGSGAGDVKLATAIGSVLGVERGLSVLIWCHLSAGAVVMAWVIWKIGPLTLARTLFRQIGSWFLPAFVSPPNGHAKQILAQPVPLATFFAIGTLLTLWKG